MNSWLKAYQWIITHIGYVLMCFVIFIITLTLLTGGEG